VTYREHCPDARLAGWVECVWTLESERGVAGYPVRPDGCLDLIWAPETGAQVVGTMTVERRYDLAAGGRTFGVRFRPGMAGALLRVEAAELTDRTLALEDVWGGEARQVEARIAEAGSLAAAARALSSSLAAPDAAPDGVRRAIAAITAAHGEIDLEWVARQAGMSAAVPAAMSGRERADAEAPLPGAAIPPRLRDGASGCGVGGGCGGGGILRSIAPDSGFSRVHRRNADVRFFQYCGGDGPVE
jgi:hypothetical protein